MSKLSIWIAAGAGAALASLLHVQQKASTAEMLKAAAQKQLDTYKPQVIDLVKKQADRLEGEVVTQTDVAHLQAMLFEAVDKTSLPDMAKMALKLAVLNGVTDARIAGLSTQGVSMVGQARDAIIVKIQGARL